RRFLGTVGIADLLSPIPVMPRPQTIGGMATPWGVYLTTGSVQAGVGNWALVGSGLALGSMLMAARFGVGFGAWAVQKATGLPCFAVWKGPEPSQLTMQTLGWAVLQCLSLPLFLILMRSFSLSQFHAAEHQAVHAMERGEPLRIEVLKRMP